MSRAEFYRLTSAAINRARTHVIGSEERDGIELAARELAKAYAAHNEKFDAVRFLKDCGLL